MDRIKTKSHRSTASSHGHLVVMVTDFGAGTPLLTNHTPSHHPNKVFSHSFLIVSFHALFISIIYVIVTTAGISKENQQLLFQEGMQFNPEKLQTGKTLSSLALTPSHNPNNPCQLISTDMPPY